MEDIQQKILDDIKCRESWRQPLVLPHSNKIINLSNAIGKNPTTPPDAPDQPDRYIQQSKYQLDKYYKGIEMYDEVKQLIKNACPECILVQNRGKGKSMSCIRWQLSCSCCFTVDESAGILGISSRSANYQWKYARAWLLQELAPS